MGNLHTMEIGNGFSNLFGYLAKSCIRYWTIGMSIRCKRGATKVFHDYVYGVRSFKEVKNANDVSMFYAFHYFYLAHYVFAFFFSGELKLGNSLDDYLLGIFPTSAKPHPSITSLSQNFPHRIPRGYIMRHPHRWQLHGQLRLLPNG